MKTKDQILNSRPVFLHDWKKGKAFQVFMDFEHVYITYEEYIAKKSPYKNEEAWEENKRDAQKALLIHAREKILFATYTYENYSGSAFVIFSKDNTLYEVNGSHCSCYGLEGQWKPEEVSLKELENRIVKGGLGKEYGSGDFKKELKKFLGIK